MTSLVLSLYRSATGQAILLFLYLFLVLTSYVVGKVARDALFLDQFKAVQLPYADIAIALLVGGVVAAYVRLGRFFRLDRLLMLSLMGYSLTAAAFWMIGTRYEVAWIYPVVYVWIGIFGVLATAQVWTLATFVFTTREAKSSFSVIGSGAISGWIVGGYLSKALASRFGAESLLLVMAFALAASTFVVAAIWNARENVNGAGRDESATHEPVVAQFRKIMGMPHVRAIAALICLSSFATTTSGWQFKAIAKQSIPSTDALAAFFGEFNFYAGILSLLVQLFLTSRILKRFGIGPALLVVPIALLLGAGGLLAFGTLAAAVVLKGFDQVFRYSVDKSTVEMLYLPLASEVKVQAKSFVDTVIWRMGDGFAGVGILVAANYLELSARSVGWITLGSVLLWGCVALIARRTYVRSLSEIVQSAAPAPLAPEPPSPRLESYAPLLGADEDQLAFMLKSRDLEMQRAGIALVALQQRRNQAASVIDRLDNADLSTVAKSALIAFGNSVTDTLHDHLANPSVRPTVRVAITDVLVGIGTQKALRALEGNLDDRDPQVRDAVICGIARIVKKNTRVVSDARKVENALALEIAQHYRSYQVLVQQTELAKSAPAKTAALRETIEVEARRIFRLLSVRYPGNNLHAAYAAIRSRVPTLRDTALELLENTLDPRLRRMVLPLFDESLSLADRAAIGMRLFGNASATTEARSNTARRKSMAAAACGPRLCYSAAIARAKEAKTNIMGAA
ncbi:MAG TPA: Npt1/Npt2 family nucleotide transporter [Terriglobales bacterium]|nr:Npt1/Npt2 family nucleotide transporter [Terriglobales bacterium]